MENEIARQNESLQAASMLIFGSAAELRIVDPKSLKILKENARYFKKGTFQQLTENIRKDKRLSSVPLCYPVGPDLEVLSGNHRTQAAIEAGIKWIMVLVILEDVDKDRKISIQLSHNSLVGEDDKQILSNLWAQIDDISAKCYAGISSETIGDLKKLKLSNFSTPALRTKSITFAFTEMEFAALSEIIAELEESPADLVYLADLEKFSAFFSAVLKTKKKLNIKNASLAIRRLIEAANTITGKDLA